MSNVIYVNFATKSNRLKQNDEEFPNRVLKIKKSLERIDEIATKHKIAEKKDEN